jgi:hypothetical protein
MSEIDALMVGFQNGLTKEALSPVLARVAPALGSGAGAGGLLGLAGGAGYGATKPYLEARRRGAGVGEAALHGLGGAFGGAAKGALLGAGIGGLGLSGLAALGRGTGVAGRLAAGGGPLGAAARFGQRQVHGVTGWTPEAGLRTIRGGAWGAQQRARELRESVRKGKFKPTWFQRVRGVPEGEAAAKAQVSARKYLEAARKAEQMGLTSIPGYARSLAKQPVKTLKAGLGEQWHAMGPFGRSLIYGYPVVGTAGALAQRDEPGGPGRMERLAEPLGALAYGMGPLPIGTQLALAGALSGGLKGVGKLTKKDRTPRRHAEPPGPVEPAGGETEAEDYIFTPRAMGLQ